MLFKQKVLKEEWIKFALGNGGVLLLPCALTAYGLIVQRNMHALLLLLLFSPLFLAVCLFSASYLEWFHIYDDRIEARSIFGIKNVVYFRDVEYVEVLEIALSAKGAYIPFFMFHDGRDNNHNFVDASLNSCYNKRKRNLRMPKTEKMEAFLQQKQIRMASDRSS